NRLMHMDPTPQVSNLASNMRVCPQRFALGGGSRAHFSNEGAHLFDGVDAACCNGDAFKGKRSHGDFPTAIDFAYDCGVWKEDVIQEDFIKLSLIDHVFQWTHGDTFGVQRQEEIGDALMPFAPTGSGQ